jgi:cell division protein FtsB
MLVASVIIIFLVSIVNIILLYKSINKVYALTLLVTKQDSDIETLRRNQDVLNSNITLLKKECTRDKKELERKIRSIEEGSGSI